MNKHLQRWQNYAEYHASLDNYLQSLRQYQADQQRRLAEEQRRKEEAERRRLAEEQRRREEAAQTIIDWAVARGVPRKNLPANAQALLSWTTLDLPDLLEGRCRSGKSDLPEAIGYLTNLRTLNLRGLNISNLPDSIGNLANLQQLDLNYNSLQNLPDNIGNLTNLQQLNLGRNSLQKLPDSIGNLVNLNYLDLCDNPLIKLPIGIKKLRCKIDCDNIFTRIIRFFL